MSVVYANCADRAIANFIAIVSHKWVESFAVGVSLVRLKMKKLKFLLLIGVYSLAEPLGVGIGTLILLFMPVQLLEEVAEDSGGVHSDCTRFCWSSWSRFVLADGVNPQELSFTLQRLI